MSKLKYKVSKRPYPSYNSFCFGYEFHNMVDISLQKLINDKCLTDKYEILAPRKNKFKRAKLNKRKVLFKGLYKDCIEYAYSHGFFIGCW